MWTPWKARTFSILIFLHLSLLAAVPAHAQATRMGLDGWPDVRSNWRSSPSSYVVVEVGCPVMSGPALCTIGHELHHALEIASAPSVVDSESLAQLFTEIGFHSRMTNPDGQFETADAVAAGERIHHELFHPEDFTRRLAQDSTTKGGNNDHGHVSTGTTSLRH